MDRQRVARELLAVARELTAGIWSLPKNSGDVRKAAAMVKRMRVGDRPLPGRPDPGEAFYSLLGDDELFDDFTENEKIYYRACADAVTNRVKKLAAMKADDFNDPSEFRLLQELAKSI